MLAFNHLFRINVRRYLLIRHIDNGHRDENRRLVYSFDNRDASVLR